MLLHRLQEYVTLSILNPGLGRFEALVIKPTILGLSLGVSYFSNVIKIPTMAHQNKGNNK